MAFRCWADGSPLYVIFWSHLPSSSKKTLSEFDPLWQNFLDQHIKAVYCPFKRKTACHYYVWNLSDVLKTAEFACFFLGFCSSCYQHYRGMGNSNSIHVLLPLVCKRLPEVKVRSSTNGQCQTPRWGTNLCRWADKTTWLIAEKAANQAGPSSREKQTCFGVPKVPYSSIFIENPS